MRRLFPLLAAMSVLACDAGVSGTYDLVSWDGEELPASFEFFGTTTVTSGSIALTGDSTFTFTMTSYDDDEDPEPFTFSGTFTLDESNAIHFTPGPESNEEPFDATWDGDQITISDDDTLVFQR